MVMLPYLLGVDLRGVDDVLVVGREEGVLVDVEDVEEEDVEEEVEVEICRRDGVEDPNPTNPVVFLLLLL